MMQVVEGEKRGSFPGQGQGFLQDRFHLLVFGIVLPDPEQCLPIVRPGG